MSGYIDWQHLNYIILYRLVYAEKVRLREWYMMVFSIILRIAHFSFCKSFRYIITNDNHIFVSCSHRISFYLLKNTNETVNQFRCNLSRIFTQEMHVVIKLTLMFKPCILIKIFQIIWCQSLLLAAKYEAKSFQRWQAQVLWDDEGMTLVPSNI